MGSWVWSAWSVVLGSALFWGGLIVLVLQSNDGNACPISDSLQNSSNTRIMYGALGTVIIVDRSACFRWFGTAVDHFNPDTYPEKFDKIIPFHFQMTWWIARIVCWGMSVVMAYMVVAVPENDGSGGHWNVSAAFYGFYEVQELLAIPQRCWETWLLELEGWPKWRRLGLVALDFVVGFGGMLSFSIAYIVEPPGCELGTSCHALMEWWVVGFSIIALFFQVLDIREVGGPASQPLSRKSKSPAHYLTTVPMNADNVEDLKTIAAQSMEANLQNSGGMYAKLLSILPRAGANQYNSIWIRDACFASEALCSSEITDGAQAVQNVIEYYVKNFDPATKTGPKVFDSMDFEWRQIRPVLRRMFCCGMDRGAARALPIDTSNLKRFYKTTQARGREVVDSNALIIIAEYNHYQASNKHHLLKKDEIEKLLSYYSGRDLDNLIVQHPFSDWEDSLEHSGACFTTNLLVWKARKCATEMYSDITTNAVLQERAMDKKFRIEVVNDQRYVYCDRLVPDGASKSVSLDGNLLAAKWGFGAYKTPSKENTSRAFNCYETLKLTTAWQLSAVKYPGDSRADVFLWSRLAGLAEYHNAARWSWIIALQATVALKFGDVTEYDRLAGALLTACRRYDHVPEVFSPNSPMTELRRWRTYGYESEGPFLWGAAFVWECAHKRAKAQNPALYDPSVMDLTRV